MDFECIAKHFLKAPCFQCFLPVFKLFAFIASGYSEKKTSFQQWGSDKSIHFSRKTSLQVCSWTFGKGAIVMFLIREG